MYTQGHGPYEGSRGVNWFGMDRDYWVESVVEEVSEETWGSVSGRRHRGVVGSEWRQGRDKRIGRRVSLTLGDLSP